MKPLARAVALAALAAIPVLAAAAPAGAYCTVAPVGPADVTYCREDTSVCVDADTHLADAGACASRDGVSCYVAIPDRPLIVCA